MKLGFVTLIAALILSGCGDNHNYTDYRLECRENARIAVDAVEIVRNPESSGKCDFIARSKDGSIWLVSGTYSSETQTSKTQIFGPMK